VSRWSLRTQLLVMGLLTAVGPLVILLGVVFQVEETENLGVDDGSGVSRVDTISETGVSPWIPLAALALAIGAVVLVWFWAKRAVDPIDRMAALSDEVQAGSLDRRLELTDAPVEVRRLGASFDRMLDRLATASALERQLIEDASHELRTPLAALAARLEVAGQRASGEDLADDLRLCEVEVERLQGTLDQLLASARSRQSSVEQVDNDIVAIVHRVVERQRLLTPDVTIEVRAPNSVRLGVEGAVVERAVGNLLTNAAEHGAAPILIAVDDDGSNVAIAVTDAGPGIGADRLPRIFDRYDGERHGIGLAIVKQVADAYGAIDVESPVDGDRGARFRLTLRRDC